MRTSPSNNAEEIETIAWPSEAEVQDAITASLAEYFLMDGVRFQHFLPYANQQGINKRNVPGDLIATIASSKILILEIKAAAGVDNNSILLDSFDDVQQDEYEFLNAVCNIPVHYAFNNTSMLASHQAGEFRALRCVHTLRQIELVGSEQIETGGKIGSHARIPPRTLLEMVWELTNESSKIALTQPILSLLTIATSQLKTPILILIFSSDFGVFKLSRENLEMLFELALREEEASKKIRAAFTSLTSKSIAPFEAYEKIIVQKRKIRNAENKLRNELASKKKSKQTPQTEEEIMRLKDELLEIDKGWRGVLQVAISKFNSQTNEKTRHPKMGI